MKEIGYKFLKKIFRSIISHLCISIIVFLFFMADFIVNLDLLFKKFLLNICIFKSDTVNLILNNMRDFFSLASLVIILVAIILYIFTRKDVSSKNEKLIIKALKDTDNSVDNGLFYLLILQIVCLISVFLKKNIVFVLTVVINTSFILYCFSEFYYSVIKLEQYKRRSKEFVLIYLILIMFVVDILFPLRFDLMLFDDKLSTLTHVLGYFGINGIGFFLEYKANQNYDDILKDGFWGFNRDDLLTAMNYELLFLSSEIMMVLKYILIVTFVLAAILQIFFILTVGMILIYLIYAEIQTKSYLYMIEIENEQLKAVKNIFASYFADCINYSINPLERIFVYIDENLSNEKNYSEINRVLEITSQCILKYADNDSLKKLLYNSYQICQDLPQIQNVLSRFFVTISRTMMEREMNDQEDRNDLETARKKYENFVYIFIRLIVFQVTDENQLRKIISNIYHLELYDSKKFIHIFIWVYCFYKYQEHIFNPTTQVLEEVNKCASLIKDLFFVSEIKDRDAFILWYYKIYKDFPPIDIDIAQLTLLKEGEEKNNYLDVKTIFIKLFVMEDV